MTRRPDLGERIHNTLLFGVTALRKWANLLGGDGLLREQACEAFRGGGEVKTSTHVSTRNTGRSIREEVFASAVQFAWRKANKSFADESLQC